MNDRDKEVIVTVLDSGPWSQLDRRGWRGHEFFRGHWDATPTQIAEAVGARLLHALEVHAVYRGGDATCVVLRWATRYSCVEPASPPPVDEDSAASRAPTLVPPSRQARRDAHLMRGNEGSWPTAAQVIR